MANTTVPTFVAAIITRNTPNGLEILMTQRSDPPFAGQWCLPGGHIERFEPAREAIIREVKEETGLDFEPQFFNYFDEIIPERGIHAVSLVFVGQGKGEACLPADEVGAYAWLRLEACLQLELAFRHEAILRAFGEGGIR